MRVAVAGGTGVVGTHVVSALATAGHDPVVLSRSAGVDLTKGTGLDAALEGCWVIVDVTNSPSITLQKATGFFTAVTRHLHEAGARAGVARLVTLSIVGVDRNQDYGYYMAKLRQEELALAGPLPATIVRATQFHEFPAQILRRSRFGPLALMPDMRVQPIAARTVGELLAERATTPVVDAVAEPITEIAGPREERLVDMARALAQRRHRRCAVLSVRMPGAAGRVMRKGRVLPAPGAATLLGPTFADWLEGDDARTIRL